jgi:alkylated DNA repair protein alkB homolog 1
MSPSIPRFAAFCIYADPEITFFTGIPRILESTLPQHLEVGGDDPEWTKEYEEYLRTTRINVNVRQVFPKGFDVT